MHCPHFLLNSLEIILVFEQLSAFHLKLSQDSLQNILVSDEIIPVSVQIIHVSQIIGESVNYPPFTINYPTHRMKLSYVI